MTEDNLRDVLADILAQWIGSYQPSDKRMAADAAIAALAARNVVLAREGDIACNCANGDGTTAPKYHAPTCPIAARGDAPTPEPLRAIAVAAHEHYDREYGKAARPWIDAALAATDAPTPEPYCAHPCCRDKEPFLLGGDAPTPHDWRDHSSSPHHHDGDSEPIWGVPTESTDTRALDGRAVHAAWRDGMLAQGRSVAPERMAWDTLSDEDRALDEGIAARLAATESTDTRPCHHDCDMCRTLDDMESTDTRPRLRADTLAAMEGLPPEKVAEWTAEVMRQRATEEPAVSHETPNTAQANSGGGTTARADAPTPDRFDTQPDEHLERDYPGITGDAPTPEPRTDDCGYECPFTREAHPHTAGHEWEDAPTPEPLREAVRHHIVQASIYLAQAAPTAANEELRAALAATEEPAYPAPLDIIEDRTIEQRRADGDLAQPAPALDAEHRPVEKDNGVAYDGYEHWVECSCGWYGGDSGPGLQAEAWYEHFLAASQPVTEGLGLGPNGEETTPG